MPLNQELLQVLQRISEGQPKLVNLQRFGLSTDDWKQTDEEGRTYLHHAAIMLKGLLGQLANKEINQEDKNVGEQRIAELVKAMEYLMQKGVPALEEDKDGEKFTKGLTIIENVRVDKLLILEEFEKISFLCTKGAVQSGQINRLIDRIRKYNNNFIVNENERINISTIKNQTGLTLMEVIVGTKFPTKFRESDYTFINTILENSGDMFNFKYMNDKGQTFLHMAVEKKLLDVLPLFIVRGVDKSAKDSEGKMYDEYSTEEERQIVTGKVKELELRQGTYEVFRLIDLGTIDNFKRYVEEHNMEFTATNSDGVTLAEYAADHLNIEVVKYMIEKDPMLLTRRFKGNNTLLHIIMNSNVVDDKARQDLIGFILSKETKADFINAKNDFNDTALSIAVRRNMYEEGVKFVDSGVDINLPSGPEDLPPLFILVRNMCAMKSKDSRLLEVLVEKGAHINAGDKYGNTPFSWAVMGENSEIVKLLLEKGADINLEDYMLLHWAVKEDKKEIVEILLGKGVNVNLEDENGNTPLYLAVNECKKEVIELLLKKGADVNLQHKNGDTLLHRAIRGNKKEIIELLLEKEIDVNLRNEIGNTPLHEAAWRGQAEVVRLLLKKGADINAKNEDGYTPLHIAANDGQTEVAKLLLVEKGADINAREKYGYTPLHKAAMRGQAEVVRLLLVEKGADINAKSQNGNTPLHEAVERYKTEVVKLLLEKGVDVNLQNVNGYTPLHIAAGHGQIEVVDLLLKKGADINLKDSHGDTALHKAVEMDQAKVVNLLVEKGADINLEDGYGDTLLHYIAKKGRTEVMNLLLKKGAYINLKDRYGNTLLHYVAKEGRTEIIKVLLENGVDTNSKNKKGSTPLHLAALEGKEDMARLLLGNGANINSKNKHGRTPLHFAVLAGEENIVRLLLENGADINSKSKLGNTPLHMAAEKGYIEVVKLLLENGADINLKNKNGSTPLHFAAWKGNEDMMKLLLENGADINSKNKDGRTQSYSAVWKGKEEVVELLLTKGTKEIEDIKEYMKDTSFISAKLIQVVNETLKKTENKFAMWRTKSQLEILESLQRARGLLREQSGNLDTIKQDFRRIAGKIRNGEPIKDEQNVVWDAIDKAGNTLLHLAVRAGNKDAVKFLVEKVDVNICNNMGYTPLFMATVKKKSESDKSKTGAVKDVIEPQKQEKRSDIATDAELESIISILKEHNAKMVVKNDKTTMGYKRVFGKHCKTKDGRHLIKDLQKEVDVEKPKVNQSTRGL